MEIRKKIARLSENSLRRNILIPMLKAMGAYNTEDFHGSSEKGKDVYFSYKNIFERYKHCCFFIKVGNVKKSGRNDIRKMQKAIEEAIQRDFPSPIDNKTPIHIEEFYFVCSGKINKEAREWLSDLLRKKQTPNFDIFDIDNLNDTILDLLKKYNRELCGNYEFSVRTFSKYCDRIVDHKQKKYIHYDDSITNYSEGKIIKKQI